jgi:hypothetical protein
LPNVFVAAFCDHWRRLAAVRFVFQPTSARLALDLDVATETGRKVMAANVL